MGTIAEWGRIRKEIKKEFEEKGIVTCEIMFPDICMYDNFLSFAHRHKRIWYDMRENKGKLGKFNQVILACTPCHDRIEQDKEITRQLFNGLRGREDEEIDKIETATRQIL